MLSAYTLVLPHDDSLQDLCEKLEERTDKKLHLNLIHLI